MVETDILKYWYDMEFFSPTTPTVGKDTRYLKKKSEKITWIQNKEYVLSYDIYIGKARVDDLVNEMIQKTGVSTEEKIEKDGSSCCLCGLKVDDNKEVVAGSFSISPFMYAICKIINSRSIDVNFKEEDITKINERINSFFKPGIKITEQDIYNIYVESLETIGLDSNLIDFYCTINCKIVKKRNSKKEDDKQDDKTDILESFYAKDIKWVLKNASEYDSIYDYIGALNKEVKNKVEIDLDEERLKEVLNPNNYPMGKWPSVYKPSLMQQVAINLSIKKDIEKFSVNGPPGTGKTTLLKEIIASYIVDRAEKMCNYKNPDDAFVQKSLKIPFSIYSYYYEIDSKLADYGILVASNNNKAVENITTELPKLKDMKNTMTNLFNLQSEKELYFTKLANDLIENKEECWGLISARLGNKNNINKFKQALWFNDNSLRNTEEKVDWQEAKQEFKNTYNKVLQYRNYIIEAVSDVEKYSLIKSYITTLQDNINNQSSLKNNIGKAFENKNNIEAELQNQDELIKDIKTKMNIIQKIANMFKTNDEIIKVVNKKIELRNKLQEEDNTIFVMQQKINQLKSEEEELKIKIDECKLLESKIKKYKKEFSKNYADFNFWKELKKDSKLQTTCPWTTDEYDKLREELFYKAVKLQKAFVLNSRAVKHNFGLFVNIAGLRFRRQTTCISSRANYCIFSSSCNINNICFGK